ncbi:MAG: DnaD domain protein [Bacilli bacterium]|nr:DnaD domain protein [Bacilli bacterium]
MKMITLLPADTYTVINKSIITEEDRKNIISLYEPIIGPIAVSLYFTLLRDIRLSDYVSNDYTHHHLMAIMKSSIDVIRIARESLEGVGLIRSLVKEGDNNSYVYELYAPLSPKEFFSSPVFNVTLYNNIGKTEYDNLILEFQIPKVDLKEYEDISKEIDLTFKSSPNMETFETKDHNSLNLRFDSNVDFDLLISSLPKGIIRENTFTKKLKELINQLAYIYDLDTLKMIEIIRTVITDKGTIDREELRKQTRKYYQYNNNGRLPTLVYRTQPEYLKSPQGDTSPRAQIIYMFENTSPRDFLTLKNKGTTPTARELKLLEELLTDLELKPAVVNVLIDYVLKKNNNKLNQAFIETIASQWKRCNVETAEEAMELAIKENAKYNKKLPTNKKVDNNKPVWFNADISKEEITKEEQEELEDLLKDFR